MHYGRILHYFVQGTWASTDFVIHQAVLEPIPVDTEDWFYDVK